MNTKKTLLDNRIDTGYSCSFTINTKGKRIPVYLVDFLREISTETNLMFDVRAIIDNTPHLKTWQKHNDNIKDTDTLAQVVCTLNVETNLKDFELYTETIINNDILPFLVGCNFDMLGLFLRFLTPQKYIGIADKGDTSIVIHLEGTNESILTEVLKDSFGMDKYKIEESMGYFDMVGWYRVEDCLTTHNTPKVIELLNLIGIKYEIE